jgi:hypothetical protein
MKGHGLPGGFQRLESVGRRGRRTASG